MKVRVTDGDDYIEAEGASEFVSWATGEFHAMKTRMREMARVAAARHACDERATAFNELRDAAVVLRQKVRQLERSFFATKGGKA